VWVPDRVVVAGTAFHVRTWLGDGGGAAARGADDVRPLALLLHGWPEDGSAWTAVAPLIDAAGVRVVAPDLKGFGASDAPRRGYDPATLADETSQLVRALGARRATLVGHDWGGAVAVATALRHPGLVDALVVASTPFREVDLAAAWHIPLLNVPVLPELAFAAFGGTLTRAALRHAAASSDVFDEEVVERYADAVSRRPHGWLAYYRVLSRRTLVAQARRSVRRRVGGRGDLPGAGTVRVPTCVVWGEDDPVTPARLAEGVAAELGGEVVVIPGVGHFVAEEAPEATARAILATMGRAGIPLARAA
jgi:pimeloyl-ACP methyl ester carboxylesterase